MNEELEKRIEQERRIENEKRVLKVLKKHKVPLSTTEIGGMGGVYTPYVTAIVQNLRRRGLAKYIPAKRCKECGQSMVETAGWIYIGKGGKRG